MKKPLVLIACAAFFLALAAPVFAEAREVTLTGWITDEYCGASNATAEGAGCAKACAEKGADMMLYSGGKLYRITDKKMALEHVGHEVVVTGTLDEPDLLTPIRIAKADPS